MNLLVRTVVMCAALILFGMANGASAATTLYNHSGNFGFYPDPVNPAAAIGLPDGASAVMPNNSWIAFQTTPGFTTLDLTLEFASVSGSGTALFYVGRSNAVGTFSNLAVSFRSFGAGTNLVTSAGLSAHCANIGGCDVFILRPWGGGTTFALDSAVETVLAASPEPGAWALLIVGFAGLAGRLKALRRRRPFALA